MADPLLEVRGLTKRFPLDRSLGEVLTRGAHRVVNALNGVDLSVRKGETLGIVGEFRLWQVDPRSLPGTASGCRRG